MNRAFSMKIRKQHCTTIYVRLPDMLINLPITRMDDNYQKKWVQRMLRPTWWWWHPFCRCDHRLHHLWLLPYYHHKHWYQIWYLNARSIWHKQNITWVNSHKMISTFWTSDSQISESTISSHKNIQSARFYQLRTPRLYWYPLLQSIMILLLHITYPFLFSFFFHASIPIPP